MAWVPISESGIGLTPSFTDGVTMAGSIVTGVKTGEPIDQSWSIAMSDSGKVRITIQQFNSSGYVESGSFLLDSELIDNVGGADVWSPNPVISSGEVSSILYMPGEQSDYPSDSYTMLIEVEQSDCCPKSGGRLFKGIASKYRANQHQPVRARRFQKRCLQVDFSGALEKDETITKVTWECYSPWVTFMQDACVSLDCKRVCVDVTLNYSGIGDVKATVETTSGTVENYEFSITVTDAPMYPSAQYIPSNGPYKIVVEA